jgi:predicted enzyme related to lactoylglutathione lyase
MVQRDTPWDAGTPCWVELMTSDQAAAREFYSALFGWEIEVGGEETGHYGMASIGGRSVAGIGGMMGLEHPPVWNTYLATESLDLTCKQAEAAGGTIVSGPMDVMEFGRMAFVQVPGGGVFGLWQAGTHYGCQLANEPGAYSWNEFMTRDYEGGKSFYGSLFDYAFTELGDDDFQYATIDLDGRPVGGIGSLPAAVPSHVPPHWRVYFEVADCDAAVARVSELGGSVLRPPADMPYGRHADVADPQGAMFSVIKSATPQG